jgi:hypothetical protein
MWQWIKQLDRILRGEATRPSDLREGMIAIPAAGIALVVAVLAAIYGLCMGCFALFREGEPSLIQFLASAVKVPALFFLTLVVTFPSLYVFNALVGSRLNVLAVLRLLVAAMGVNLAVLAAIGPIVAFFSVCTTSYEFMVLLNVLVFGVSGLLGLTFLLQTLNRLSIATGRREPSGTPLLPPNVPGPAVGPTPPGAGPGISASNETPPASGPLDQLPGHVLGRHVKSVFGCWVLIFGLVGAQMGWVLRPFVGVPHQPFQWFRARESSFFEAVWQTLRHLFS